MLTIVVPYHNRAKFLPATLASLPLDAAIILVDNGSTDESAKICGEYAEKAVAAEAASTGSPRVRCISCAKRGASAARNAGLALVETPWVYFFDSDDLFEAAFTHDLLPHLTADLDMVCVPVKQSFYNDNDNEYEDACTGGNRDSKYGDLQVREPRLKVRDFRPTADVRTQIATSHLATVNMIFRTEWLRGIGGWDERLSTWDDWELGTRALLHHPRLKWVTERAYHHILLHPDSQTGASFSSRFEAEIRALSSVESDILTLAPQSEQARLLRTLWHRKAILAGHLLREGMPQERVKASGLLSQSLKSHFLTLYVRLGGRGAWRF